MPVFKKPRSILARSKAVTKLSKLSQFWGGGQHVGGVVLVGGLERREHAHRHRDQRDDREKDEQEVLQEGDYPIICVNLLRGVE